VSRNDLRVLGFEGGFEPFDLVTLAADLDWLYWDGDWEVPCDTLVDPGDAGSSMAGALPDEAAFAAIGPLQKRRT
jgi:hypothetical protein